MTHRNTSKTRSKIPVEILLGRRVRLPAVADFDLCEPILFNANENKKTVPATCIIRKGLNTSFIQPENSARTILVSDNQNARLDEDNVKIEPAMEETTSQSKQQLQSTDVGLYFKMKLLQPHLQETENNPTDLENLYLSKRDMAEFGVLYQTKNLTYMHCKEFILQKWNRFFNKNLCYSALISQ